MKCCIESKALSNFVAAEIWFSAAEVFMSLTTLTISAYGDRCYPEQHCDCVQLVVNPSWQAHCRRWGKYIGPKRTVVVAYASNKSGRVSHKKSLKESGGKKPEFIKRCEDSYWSMSFMAAAA